MIDKSISNRYVISDLHIGHKNIHKFRETYQGTEEDHWNLALEGLMSVPKKATLHFLGDITFSKEDLLAIGKIPCRNKILICGNHDTDNKVTMEDISSVYDQVYSLRKYKGFWQQHSSIHSSELRGFRQIHGHTHYHLMLDDEGQIDTRYINTCVEYTGYTPVPWEYIISDEYTQECKKLWTDYKTRGIIKTK